MAPAINFTIIHKQKKGLLLTISTSHDPCPFRPPATTTSTAAMTPPTPSAPPPPD